MATLLRVAEAESQVSARLSSHLEVLGKNLFSKLLQVVGRI